MSNITVNDLNKKLALTRFCTAANITDFAQRHIFVPHYGQNQGINFTVASKFPALDC